MAAEEVIKQANFRLDQQTAEKFRNFCKEMGLNQSQGFEHLIALMEMNKAKGVVSSRATEIEDFEQHAKALMSAYLYSIELNENAEARVKDQFEGALKSKDIIISDLQKKIEEQKTHDTELLEAKKEITSIQKEKNDLQEKINFWKEQVDKAEEKSNDKNRQIVLLTEKLAQLDDTGKENKELKAESSQMQDKIHELENTIATQERAAREASLNARLELSEALRDQDKEIARLKIKLELLETQKKEAIEKVEAQQKELFELKIEINQKDKKIPDKKSNE